MNRQQPLALAPPAGSADWSERSLLDPATRKALCSMNLAFLNLAAELAEEGRLKLISGLPPRAIDALIDPEAQQRLCERLPFALFELRFDDSDFWEGQIAAAGGVRDAHAALVVDERIVAFTRTAIMLAWHLAPALAARFGSRARFWLQFEGCAAHPDDKSVSVLQQLGLQIQGADSARLQALQRRPRRAALA